MAAFNENPVPGASVQVHAVKPTAGIFPIGGIAFREELVPLGAPAPRRIAGVSKTPTSPRERLFSCRCRQDLCHLGIAARPCKV